MFATTHSQRRVYGLLFLCAALICSLASYGDLSTIDGRVMLDAARHLASGAGFVVDPALGIPGTGGRFYSYYGPANSLLMLVPVAAARAVAALLPLHVPVPLVQEFLCAMAGACLKAIGVVLTYAILQRFEDNRRGNVLAALALLLAGFDFQYARSYFAEVPAAVCLLAATLALLSRDAPFQRQTLGIGSALAVGLAFRWDMALFAPIFLLIVWRRRRPPVARGIATFALPIAVVLIGLGAYNTMRFGAFWRTGYERLPLPSWPFAAWLGLLLSPGAGLLSFAPWVAALCVLPFLETRRDDDRFRDLVACVVAMVAIAIPFYGSWGWWTGGVAWGPRFLVPLVPLLGIVCIRLGRIHPGARRAGGILAAACVVMNALLLIAPHERLRAYGEVQGWTETQRVWSPWRSPWVQQPRMALQVLERLPRIHDFAERAQERTVVRSQVRRPQPIDMAEALQSSVTLNVPAVWWVRLIVLGVPAWAAGLFGVSLGVAVLILLRFLLASDKHRQTNGRA